MSTTTSVMFTALPNGGPAKAYNLSVFVSPRLEGGGPTGLLKDYSLGNWPKLVLNLLASPLEIELDFAGGPRVRAMATPECLAGLSPELWEKVFPADDTKVTERKVQDHSKRWLRSYRVGVVESYIQNLYTTIAEQNPSSFPDLKGMTAITELTDAMGRAYPMIQKMLPPPRDPKRPRQYPSVPERGRATHPDRGIEGDLNDLATSLGVSHIPLAELFRAYRFFKRGNQTPYLSKDEPYDPSLIPDRPEEPKFDFHQAMAALGDHPFLLRKLGLIVDLVLVDADAVLAKGKQMQLLLPSLSPITTLTPWTRYQINATSGFRPQPRQTSDLADGMLRLDNEKAFSVIQTDPDGNMIKVFDYAVNMNHLRGQLLAQKGKNPGAKSSQAPEETSLPALRSGGLMVIRDQRDDALWDRLAAQSQFETNPDAAVLFADDVLRGYRLDVQYKGRWSSVCRWIGKYDVAGETIDRPGPDEGYLKADSASSDPGPTAGPQAPDLYLHENVFGWRNWSAVAVMPGKTIVPVPQPDKRQKESVEARKNTPGAGFDIASNFKAEPGSLPPLRYGEVYRLRARAVDLAGNSFAPPPSAKDPSPAGDQAPSTVGVSKAVEYLRHDPVPAPMLLLRGRVTEGESMERLVIRSRGDSSPVALPPELGIDESVMFNATNSRFVAPPKSTVGEAETHGAFDSLWSDPPTAFATAARESGSFDDPAVPGTQILDITGAAVAHPPVPGYKKGDPLPDGMYFINAASSVQTPYLPDVLSRGVAFMPKDGSGAVLGRAFDGASWPNLDPFALTLQGGPTMDLDVAAGDVYVPRGEMLTINYSSYVTAPDDTNEGDLKLMGRYRAMSAAGRALTKAHGWQNWMLTPFRTMTLVHAVEKPVRAPELVKMGRSRAPGETFHRLTSITADLHAPSTGEVELRGRWDDYIDDPSDSEGWKIIPRDGHVIDQQVEYDENILQLPRARGDEPPRHELGDTKHRNIHYRLLGTTRYREYFPHKLTTYEDPTTKQKLIVTPGPELPTVINVPSSARPAAPEPLYIVPTFKWVDTSTGRQRRGGGLRIYLSRGWFSSGEGELLGVVMFPAGSVSEATGDLMRRYVSQWGSDPIFDREMTKPLDPAQFTSDPAFPETAPGPVGDNILLAEENLRVRVQGFAPQWDADRKLWYVDVQFAPPHHYTFVRFGLCRYQPSSLADLEISRVVRAEFAQLMGDRTATVTQGTDSIGITVSGPSALTKFAEALNAAGQSTPVVGQAATVAPVSKVTQGLTAAAAPAAGGVVSTPVAGPVVVPVGPIIPLPLPLLVSNPAAGAGHRVIAQIESRTSGLTGDLGWAAIDSGSVLAPYTSTLIDGNVYWKGSVRWPRSDLPTGRDYRLVLKEFEVYETDVDVAEAFTSSAAAGKPVRSRLVYVDVFPLDRSTGPVFTNG